MRAAFIVVGLSFKKPNFMKKIVAFTAFFAFFIFQIKGQGDLRFGFQASPVFSWLTSDDNRVNTNGLNAPGLKLGVVGEYYFRENYAIFGGAGFAFNHGGTLLHDNGGELWNRSQTTFTEVPELSDFEYNIQ